MRNQHFFAAVSLVAVLAAAPARADDFVAVDQGWKDPDKAKWYAIDQGSRLLPQSWLLALEQPDAQEPFLAPAFIESFRYIPGKTAKDLPIGFAVDIQDDSALGATHLRWKSPQGPNEPWVGMTCAACHTNDMTYQGKRLRVEGAPALADFQLFREALDKALVQTNADSNKFDRFAKQVVGANAADRARLQGALVSLIEEETALGSANATPLRYGYGRLDAIGNIFNKVAHVVKAPGQYFHAADAPVNYPFLWNTPQLNIVEWDGIAPNIPLPGGIDVGALIRNTGEAIGVFGDLQVNYYALAVPRPGYKSSINVPNLVAIEQLLQKLQPPAWPSAFPPIDPVKAQAGGVLFGQNCVGCHAIVPRADLSTRIKVANSLLRADPDHGAKAIGTDPWMACNAFAHSAKTGKLELSPSGYLPVAPLKPVVWMGSSAPLTDMLATAAVGAIIGEPGNVKALVKEGFARAAFARQAPAATTLGAPSLDLNNLVPELAPDSIEPDRAGLLQSCLTEDSPVLGYKWRPLSGIWATAPYLHNGSVASLYELLLPPSQRKKDFYVGSREFVPEHVGYNIDPSAENSFHFRVYDDAKTPIQGNFNGGHDYGNAGFSEEDRLDLVEYMKGL